MEEEEAQWNTKAKKEIKTNKNPEQEQREEPKFSKQLEKTYVMQLVEQNPEMPEEIELNRETQTISRTYAWIPDGDRGRRKSHTTTWRRKKILYLSEL